MESASSDTAPKQITAAPSRRNVLPIQAWRAISATSQQSPWKLMTAFAEPPSARITPSWGSRSLLPARTVARVASSRTIELTIRKRTSIQSAIQSSFDTSKIETPAASDGLPSYHWSNITAQLSAMFPSTYFGCRDRYEAQID